MSVRFNAHAFLRAQPCLPVVSTWTAFVYISLFKSRTFTVRALSSLTRRLFLAALPLFCDRCRK
eukprot:779767-Pleurochrysis_carterae.AAC.1